MYVLVCWVEKYFWMLCYLFFCGKNFKFFGSGLMWRGSVGSKFVGNMWMFVNMLVIVVMCFFLFFLGILEEFFMNCIKMNGLFVCFWFVLMWRGCGIGMLVLWSVDRSVYFIWEFSLEFFFFCKMIVVFVLLGNIKLSLNILVDILFFRGFVECSCVLCE